MDSKSYEEDLPKMHSWGKGFCKDIRYVHCKHCIDLEGSIATPVKHIPSKCLLQCCTLCKQRHRQGRCSSSPFLGEHDYDDINIDINSLLGIHYKVDLDEPLTAEEELTLLVDATKFFTTKENLSGSSMCACCGKGISIAEALQLDSREVDLHQACEKLFIHY